MLFPIDSIPVRRVTVVLQELLRQMTEVWGPSLYTRYTYGHCRSGILAGYMDVYSTNTRSAYCRVLLDCLLREVYVC